MGFPLLLLFPTPLTVRWRKPDPYWIQVNGADFPLMIKDDAEKERWCEQNVKCREAADHWNSQDSLHRLILYRKSCVGEVYVSESSNSQQTCRQSSCQLKSAITHDLLCGRSTTRLTDSWSLVLSREEGPTSNTSPSLPTRLYPLPSVSPDLV